MNESCITSIELIFIFAFAATDEDDLILDYIEKHARTVGSNGSVKGALIWKQMEKEQVTNNSEKNNRGNKKRAAKEKARDRGEERRERGD